jgi:hypothetical protein
VSALPPIDDAALPAAVRTGSPQARERYQAGLAFERQLVAQLAKQLTATAGESAGSGPYAQLLPDALADAITAAGGLGLAGDLASDESTSR